jgi:hypothetical protein
MERLRECLILSVIGTRSSLDRPDQKSVGGIHVALTAQEQVSGGHRSTERFTAVRICPTGVYQSS